jgi:hypothetical protein
MSILSVESGSLAKDLRVENAMPTLPVARSGAITPNLDAYRMASDPETTARYKD